MAGLKYSRPNKNNFILKKMNQYEVIQTLSDHQFICLKLSDEVSYRKHRDERKRKRPHYLITKQYLYSYDHEKYTSEDEKLYSKYKDIHERIDCLLFLREKDIVNLLDCFYFEQIEKNSKYTDKYFCTVEQLDDIVSLRYLLYKNRSRNTKEHQPLKNSLIFSIMTCCLESCRILHALGEPYFSLSPCNILINKRTRKVSMRPFIIDKLEFLRKYIDEPLGESHIDPYTVKFTENNKVVVKEFFENQIWYSPPEFVFRLCNDIDIYKMTKHKKKVYKELKHNFVNSLEVDIWAAGCIFAEMVLPYPLFSAKTLEDQVTNTISVLGYGSSDNRAETPKYVWENRLFAALAKKNIKINKLAALKGFLTSNPYFEISGIALQTLACMFEYNPAKRPSALNLMKIPIFHSLDSSTMYYRKLTEEERKAEKEGLNPILVAYVNKVEEEQIQASHNRSSISEQPKENNNNTTTDSIYEESIMLASLLNDKTKKRASPEKVMVESREKDLQHKKGENLVNYLSDNETKNTSSFVALTCAFGKLEKIYRQQLTQIGKDIREMKEALGDLKQNNVVTMEKKQNTTLSPKLSSTKESNMTKSFKFNGDVKITIERIHDIEFEGKYISKFNYEITLQIHDIVNRRVTLVGEACIDVSPLSYSSDICGWYNLYDSSRQEKTGQILIRITPQHNLSTNASNPPTLDEYPSEIAPDRTEGIEQQTKKTKLEDIPRTEYYESPHVNYTIVPQYNIEEISVTSPEKRREYEKLFETSFSENEFEKKISISPETFVFSHSSASGSNSLFDDEDDLDKQIKKSSPRPLQRYVVEDIKEENVKPPEQEDPATILTDPFLNTNDILSPSQINDEPIQRLCDHVNKTPESIEIEISTSQHADGEFNSIIDSLRRLQTELKSFSVLQ
ncbi:predicted protein [Naegleria gruberi]|uniref:Predicted protein n=1 Tax=Naegleria gruberi TaxID=5762 RepID=D2V364_NAEGR|nr:uncharacterized protein NAEGRDRAFT_46329 [Naegleria gruberi]EFC48722.1 predicted protein [Naegleria gruberi]|eukprot:XP_002681466.1 predicted protein [Naegleria gruberi strain NEG-M]